VPDGFLDALRNMYNYQTLQEVKESLFYYNEQQIARDLQNYLFALNFEIGTAATAPTPATSSRSPRRSWRASRSACSARRSATGAASSAPRPSASTPRARSPRRSCWAARTITETELYQSLRDRYVFHLKEKVLDPFLENANFRRALKDLGSEDFKTYDSKIQADVRYLIANLCDRFGYNETSAREVCLYVIDHNLARKYSLGSA
jgi:hypothetical protein